MSKLLMTITKLDDNKDGNMNQASYTGEVDEQDFKKDSKLYIWPKQEVGFHTGKIRSISNDTIRTYKSRYNYKIHEKVR